MKKPIVLCIMDGVGIKKDNYGNAFIKANKPNLDKLFRDYPNSLLEASGEAVGLPANQMGNSEVGHTNIGAGRVIYQPLENINRSIKDGSFFENKNINDVINHTIDNKSNLHIFGLLSDGGIHSHIDHLFALIDLLKDKKINVFLHLFTDGRDTLPDVANVYVNKLINKIKGLNNIKIATIGGRFYAMDRDNRWDRIKKYYDAIVYRDAKSYKSPLDAIEDNKNKGNLDEFIEPSIIDGGACLTNNDGLIVFNFRPDRLRELFYALTNQNFNEFDAKKLSNIKLVTMMPVSDDVICTNAYNLPNLNNTLGEYLEKQNLSQLRIAETEKYAHVTYFFDGGKEQNFKNCERILIPSPKVKTYDLKPEMSAYEITNKLIDELNKDKFDVVIMNFANGDMVGHTGVFDKTIKAVEAIDECIGKIFNKVKSLGGTMFITADHGNCDTMLDKDGNVVTSHSTEKVPFIITDKTITLKNGKLADIAPTILKYMKLDIPKEMTGNILIEEK